MTRIATLTHNTLLQLVAALLILSGAVLLAFGSAVNSPFIFDDTFSVIENPSITRLWPLTEDAQQPGPLSATKALPTSGRPLVNLTLAWNYQSGGLNPLGYHLFNLAVHLLSALLLFAVLCKLLALDYFGGQFARAAVPLALLTALLWAVHPLQSETVVYVTQRTELMVGLFYLATLYCSLQYWSANSQVSRAVWLVLATLASLAGMACKEVMVTAPFIVLLVERTLVSGSFRSALRRSWPLYVGLAGSWLLLLGLNISGPRAASAGVHLGVPLYSWWFTQAKIFWLYLKLAVWPWPLAIHYEMPYLTTWSEAWPWLAPLLLLAVGILALLWRRNAIGLAGAWVLIILSPTLVVPILTEMAAERRMYVPLASLVAVLIVGGYSLLRKAARDMSADAVHSMAFKCLAAGGCFLALSLIAICCRLSMLRMDAYKTELGLWKDTVAVEPDDSMARNQYGISLAKAGQLEEALQQIEIALKLKPDFLDARNNRGIVLSNLGRFPDAVLSYRELIEAQPDYARAYANLAVAYRKLSQPAQAIAAAQQGIDLARSQGDAGLAQQLTMWLANYQSSLSNPANP